ncbi:DUF6488 family protein [Chitinimonas lacunae]|uniref:DUF6488 family protein n=1 Tax=Chitinimonas lacunae TaxID=1963018 RepID=A0ABV8MRY1_9NEIS
MKSWKCLIASSVLALTTVTANAHGSHGSHGDEAPLTKESAATHGNQIVQQLIQDKKLPASWQKLTPSEVTNKQLFKGRMWVITYTNPQEKNAAKKTLYVFIDEFGNYVDANHTGGL